MKRLLSVLLLCLFCSVCWSQDQTIEVNKIVIDDYIAGATPDVSKHAFSFALRAKLFGQGESKGNGDGNGMLFSVASGWHDGIRAYYSWGSNSVTFQIGRVETKSAVSVGSKKSVGPGVLHDFVCTYDGKTMRLYVDGELSGETEYEGAITTLNAPIKVGNGGYGIGSNRMFVDKLEYYTRPLTADEISQRFAAFPAEEKAKLDVLNNCTMIFGAANTSLSDETFKTFLTLPDLPAETLTATRNAYWQKLFAEKKYEQAAPLVLEEVKALLALEVPAEEKTGDQVRRISRILSLPIVIFKLGRELPGQQAALAQAQADLKAKFPKEYALLDKISALNNSVKRLQLLELKAIGQYYDTLKDLTEARKSDKTRTIYVSTTGSNDNPGTKDAPVASLAKAFELISVQSDNQGESQNGSQNGSAKEAEKPAAEEKVAEGQIAERQVTIVELAAGTYYCDRTAVLNNAKNVLICCADDAKVVLTGAKTLADFQAVTDPAVLKRFQESVRGNVLVCDLKAAGIDDFGKLGNRGYGVGNVVHPIPDLYVNGEAQTLARWPNENEELLPFGKVISGPNAVLEGRGKRTDSNTFQYDFDRPNGWLLSDNPEENDIWANGLFQWEWASNTRKVLNIDRDKKTISVDYNNISGRFHFYFINILEELDQPGEYYIDRTAGKLYFLPPKEIVCADGKLNAKIELSVCSQRLVDLNRCQNVILKNLTLSGGRESGLMISQSTNCYVSDSTIDCFSGNGAIIDGGSFCGLFRTQIREMGACGTRLFGGDRATLTPAGHFVNNCIISDFSRIDRAYAPAFQTAGCGIVMTNNLIYDSPHHAFRTDGNDMYVARNEIHSVVYEFSDQSGIDVYCDPTYRGIVIEWNFWHHIGSSLALCGQAGIRLDDSISGVIMKKNIFYRSSGGVFGGIQIHGGHDNLCSHNTFINCKQAFSFTPWGSNRYQEFIDKMYPKYVKDPLYLKTYPFMDEIGEHFNRNYIIGNKAINCQQFQRNGQDWDIFSSNSCRTIDSAPTSDGSIPTPQRLRDWIRQISPELSRPLDFIGVTGQEDLVKKGTLRHEITPHYTEK